MPSEKGPSQGKGLLPPLPRLCRLEREQSGWMSATGTVWVPKVTTLSPSAQEDTGGRNKRPLCSDPVFRVSGSRREAAAD